MRRVLAIPAFRPLLAATVLDELAVSVGAVALAFLVYHRTGSAIGATGFFLSAVFGPAFLSPPFVSRLDQRSARSALATLYALQGLISLVLAWLVGHFSIAPVLMLVLLNGSLGVAARVLARSSWTSTTSPAGLLREANALVNSSLSICYMAGPALGGAVVAAGGTRSALFVNVGVFLLMTITVGTTSGLPKAVAEPAPTAGRLRAALAKARSDPNVRRLLGLQAAAMLFFTISIPVEVVFAQHTLHVGASGYGALLALWGAGAIIGSGIYARWRRLPSRLLISLGTLLLSAGFVVLAVAPDLTIALVGSTIAGAGNGMQVVAMRTALQEVVPQGWMALVLSLNESIFQAVPGAGILLGGGVAALAGPRPAFALASAGSLLVAGAMWIRLRGEGAVVVQPLGSDVGDADAHLRATAGRAISSSS